MHIQPRGSKRIRYAGLFTARGRDLRLTLCRKLIAQAGRTKATTDSPASPAAGNEALDEHSPASDDFQGTEEHRSGCYCRTCQSELELLGRLKGAETKAMQSLAQAIVFRMLSYFAEVAEVGYAELLAQLRIAWLRPRQLPRPSPSYCWVEHD